jgi:heme exporter protein CcmD
MMDTPHLGFIVAAYALAAAVIATMIAAILIDYRALSANLRGLEAARREKGEGAQP